MPWLTHLRSAVICMSDCMSETSCPHFMPTRPTQVTLHAHAAREEGHVSALVCTLNPKTGEVAKAKPR